MQFVPYVVSYAEETARQAEKYSVLDLYEKYGNALWENGRHRDNVCAFLNEIDRILERVKYRIFPQDMIDSLCETLLGRGNSNATINRKMAALGKLLRKAHRMGDIDGVPEFTRRKEKAGRIRFLERGEEQRLFAAIAERSEDYHRLSIFLVDSGCRLGEALGLRWNDVRDRRASFWITKSGRSRTVPLTERAHSALGGGRATTRGPFAGLLAHRYRAIWNDAKTEIGLGADEQVVPHILRHTCASRLVQGGIDIRRVQTWLGHQTLQMTMRYAHLATNDLDPGVAVLEKDGEPASR
ncbi:MAG: tyrosine-type recombinase/integrase [Rhizobiaceae bacterium]